MFDERLNDIFKQEGCCKNVNLLIGDANVVHSDVISSGFCYDFLFIDGDHSYEGCLKDINTWFPSLSPGGIIVFHDAYSSLPQNGVFDAIMEFSRYNNLNFIIPPASTSRVWETQMALYVLPGRIFINQCIAIISSIERVKSLLSQYTSHTLSKTFTNSCFE